MARRYALPRVDGETTRDGGRRKTVAAFFDGMTMAVSVSLFEPQISTVPDAPKPVSLENQWRKVSGYIVAAAEREKERGSVPV